MKRISLIAILLAFAMFIIPGCAKKEKAPADTTAAKVETTEKVEETTAAEEEKKEEKYDPSKYNPLTGVKTNKKLYNQRPVSIMVNNIYSSLPQEGVGQADILYECLAEGGIPRLLMIVSDYSSITKVGSVRSARDYYIDYAEGYDCIFVHAGGSTYAYNTFDERGTERLDGVRGPTINELFIRDPERVGKYISEHTLVVQSGEKLKEAIEFYEYRTKTDKAHKTPMNFVAVGEKTTLKDKAKHVKVVMSGAQTVDYVYSTEDGKYLRYQYNGERHIDNTTGKQLSFKNVILIFTEHQLIAGDEKNRINVQTTGTGEGWYITNGTYQKITWKKDEASSVTKYFYENGKEVKLNRGKTMINVVPVENAEYVVFDNVWEDKK